MKNLKRRVLSDVLDNKAQYLLLVFFLIVGITAGTVTISNLQNDVKTQIAQYLNLLFNTIKSKQIDYISIIINSFLQNTAIFAIITMFSLVTVGILATSIMLTFKGFCIGFTVGALSLSFGSGGLLAIVFCTFLPNLIIIPCICKAGVMGLNNSINVFRNRKIPKTTKDILIFSRPYIKKMLKVYLILLVGIILETLLIPVLIKLI